MAIPNVIHFCFGMRSDFGGRPFSFVHYLAVKSAWEVHRPQALCMHYAFEPSGRWWQEARRYLTLRKVKAPSKVYGNRVSHYAHRADVVRLDALLGEGGIYLDLDCLSLKPFRPLLRHECVLGWQGTRGLCNAVIMAEKGAAFLRTWKDQYHDFDSTQWDFHSVVLPKILYGMSPRSVHTVGPDAFFYPLFWQPRLMWSSAPVDFSPSYCVHLWESHWWETHLKHLSPDGVKRSKNNFSRLARAFL